MKISSHRHQNFEKVPTNHSKKLPYDCLSVKLELQRYEAEACYEDFLDHAEHDNLEIAYLARILQEKCLSSFTLQESCKMRCILQEFRRKKPARKMHCLARSCKIFARFVFFQLGTRQTLQEGINSTCGFIFSV